MWMGTSTLDRLIESTSSSIEEILSKKIAYFKFNSIRFYEDEDDDDESNANFGRLTR